ncbi:MAG: hypothetical protein LT071_13855, partial [Nocardioides sp.]|nr:hypothetical protein [Nocardioides sp.]
RWRRVAPGLLVPAGTPRTPEQRAVEAAAQLPADGLITGWAALRLAGAAFFAGERVDGTLEPVPVLLPHDVRRRGAGLLVERTRGPLPAAVVRHGVPCAPAEVALVHELQRESSSKRAGVMVDMALAAGVVDLGGLRRRLARTHGVTGEASYAVDRACGECRSPKESEMLQVWERLAGFPRPLMNREVRALDGRLLAVVDLLDVEAGVVGEYNGSDHRRARQQSRDEARAAALRDVGLELFTVVAGDSEQVQVDRMRAARRRALWLPEERRTWRVGAFVPAGPLPGEVDAAEQAAAEAAAAAALRIALEAGSAVP